MFRGNSHAPLSELLWRVVVEGGEVVVVAPHRTLGHVSSLTQFATIMANRGFVPALHDTLTAHVHAAAIKVCVCVYVFCICM